MASANTMGPAGQAFLWFTFAVFCLTAVGIFALAFTKNPNQRLFHYVSFTVVGVAALCYLTMCVGLGKLTVNGRDWFMGRYADWAITTPLLLLDLGTFAKLSYSNIFALIVLDLLMISAGFFGAMTTGPGQWAFFAFGVVCFIPILYFLNEDFDMERTIENVGEEAAKQYKRLGHFLVGFWMIYPVVYLLSQTQTISVDGETIFYGVLDVMSKAVFASWLLSTKPEELILDKEEEEEEFADVEMTTGEMKVGM